MKHHAEWLLLAPSIGICMWLVANIGPFVVDIIDILTR